MMEYDELYLVQSEIEDKSTINICPESITINDVTYHCELIEGHKGSHCSGLPLYHAVITWITK